MVLQCKFNLNGFKAPICCFNITNISLVFDINSFFYIKEWKSVLTIQQYLKQKPWITNKRENQTQNGRFIAAQHD